MPEQPRDPLHYDMKIPPEPDQTTLKKQESQKPPADDENRDDANSARETGTAKDTARADDKPQSVRGEK